MSDIAKPNFHAGKVIIVAQGARISELEAALAAKDTALSERDATIARLEKKVAAFRNDGLVQAALARQGSLQDERDEAVEALSEMRAELERARKALEPFAEIAEVEDEIGRNDPDDDRIWVVQAHGCQLAELCIEDFRAAARAQAEGETP